MCLTAHNAVVHWSSLGVLRSQCTPQVDHVRLVQRLVTGPEAFLQRVVMGVQAVGELVLQCQPRAEVLLECSRRHESQKSSVAGQSSAVDCELFNYASPFQWRREYDGLVDLVCNPHEPQSDGAFALHAGGEPLRKRQWFIAPRAF